MRPELHPACAAFPALPQHDLDELAEDIRKRGLIEPVTLTPNGLLLDGRCRWDACELAGAVPHSIVYDGDDPIGFVLSKNKHRRHLDKSQLAMAVARLANLQNGSNQYESRRVGHFDKVTHTTKQLAEQSGLAVSTIDFARCVLRSAEPHIVAMVDAGKVTAAVGAAATRATPRSSQQKWTESDVRHEGRKIINAFPSSQRRQPAPKTKKPPAAPIILRPYSHPNWPTPEELELPPHGTPEYDAHLAKYGRTPLHPKRVTDLRNAEANTSGVADHVGFLNFGRWPDADTFFEQISFLLSHVPQSEKTNGMETDFAAKARKTLAKLERELPKALALLLALDAKLKEVQQKPFPVRVYGAGVSMPS
jgi:hypothetical protein